MIHEEYGHCLSNFGAAHIAACEASCEEDEAIHQRREEHDLMAAQRGRAAMLQEQRKRDREAEERIVKRKRRLLKNASVQANLVTRREIDVDLRNLHGENEDEDGNFEDEQGGVRVEKFTSKPNMHKSKSNSTYDPKNFTSHSVDSSNSDEESSPELDSEVEFNQITNLLKQKSYNFHRDPSPIKTFEEIVELSDSSESEPILRPPPQRQKQAKLPVEQPKKQSILKKNVEWKHAKPQQKDSLEDQRVNYLDFGNKHVSSYTPGNDLVTQNTKKSGKNAKTEARKQEQRAGKGTVSDDVLR
jgi:hypothetical protein